MQWWKPLNLNELTGFMLDAANQCKPHPNGLERPLKAESSGSIPDDATRKINNL
jgi:hypothetical protein